MKTANFQVMIVKKREEVDEKPAVLRYKTHRLTSKLQYVFGGFVYHNNVVTGSSPLRYLSCAEFRRTGCRERATILLSNDVDNLRVTQAHNHPPDMWAMERLTFLTALKSAVRTMETATMKKVYETVAENFPVSAMEISFPSIKSTLHRWRKDPKL